MIETALLPCGMRVVVDTQEDHVVYCGIVVRAGTCQEEPADLGMAHFMEHMSFKGTEHRKALQVSQYLEGVGGELNAFTSKHNTVFSATVLEEDFRRAADVLCDLVFHSTYPQVEIDREVEVICDEIESYRDAPADLIFDEFESLLFQGEPLGRDILGEPARLKEYTTADARRWARQWYTPEHATFYAVGNVSLKKVCHELQRHTS